LRIWMLPFLYSRAVIDPNLTACSPRARTGYLFQSFSPSPRPASFLNFTAGIPADSTIR
jgi:hypothetical protein